MYTLIFPFCGAQHDVHMFHRLNHMTLHIILIYCDIHNSVLLFLGINRRLDFPTLCNGLSTKLTSKLPLVASHYLHDLTGHKEDVLMVCVLTPSITYVYVVMVCNHLWLKKSNFNVFFTCSSTLTIHSRTL